jgi:glycosyltransferase 2 family protein
MKKHLRNIIQYSFFLGLGIFLAWWSVKDLTADNKSQIKTALKTAEYLLVIPVFGMLLFSHFIRALRWRLLIQSLDYNPSKTNTFFAVMIGYLTNQAVPRLGEVVKCTMLARYEKIPADKLIGTIILERIVDAITLLIIFGITLVIQPDIYLQLTDAIFNSKKDPSQKTVSSSIILLIVAAIIVILISIWMLRKKKTFNDLITLFKKIGQRIWEGISAIRHLRKRKLFILLSIVLWSLYLLGGYIGFMALQDTQQYGIKEAFTVLSAGSVGMIVTPGGIGAYAYLLQQTMIVYGLNEGIALAFGWILWLAQTSVIVIGGLISFVAMPYYNKHKKIEKS